MEIISHRGLWEAQEEKNTKNSFNKSFDLGFGTETDVRDANGDLVISHDIPGGNEMTLREFCSLKGVTDYTLALNIKSDGLAAKLKNTLNEFGLTKWFVFDMSIPDTLGHLQVGNPVFTRLSDIEINTVLLNESVGVWLDAFISDWYGEKIILDLLNQGKKVCIVSPELHGRNYERVWEMLKPISVNENLLICTDFPIQAKHYFDN